MKFAIISTFLTIFTLVNGHCGPNQYFSFCKPCGPTHCGREIGTYCPEKLTCIFQLGCYCSPGYLRDDYGDCVEADKCNCGKNEEYLKCGPCTSDECGASTAEACLDICQEPGCYCKENYKRQNGECIEKSLCYSEKYETTYVNNVTSY